MPRPISPLGYLEKDSKTTIRDHAVLLGRGESRRPFKELEDKDLKKASSAWATKESELGTLIGNYFPRTPLLYYIQIALLKSLVAISRQTSSASCGPLG